MKSLSGATQTQLLHALRYLGLINANGVPHEKLTTLVKSEGAERQKILQNVLRSSYPFLEDKTFSLETASDGQLDEQFAKLATGDTVRKCKTFFLPAAKDAGFTVSPFIKEMGKRGTSNGKPKKPRAPAAASADKTPPDPKPRHDPPPSVLSWQEMLLAKFPSFDPTWPDDVKAKWFTSFNELMHGGAKKEGSK
jgi:hypothetical protein